MTESLSPVRIASLRHKQVPIQEQSVLVGETVGINGYYVNRAALKRRFAEGVY